MAVARPRTAQSTITDRNLGDSIRGYDNSQGSIEAGDGREVSIKPTLAALQRVAPAAAQNPFVNNSDGSFAFSPAAQHAFAEKRNELRNVGGVELDVTFQNLALVGVSDMRGERRPPRRSSKNSILISLRRLVDAAKPYAVSPER